MSTTNKPSISQDPLYQLLRNEKVDDFNKQKATGATCDLTNCDFRGLDLRGWDADGLDLTGAYFRGTDLRGINFNNTQMNHVSIASATISGCLFPKEINANEIVMSVNHGTRMRYS